MVGVIWEVARLKAELGREHKPPNRLGKDEWGEGSEAVGCAGVRLTHLSTKLFHNVIYRI